MSTARDSFFYRDIQNTLEKKLLEYGYPVPQDIIQQTLNDLFDSVALHVWSQKDVIDVAQKRGWSITPDTTSKILANIERHVDCELGITWQTIETAVDDFYDQVAQE